MSMKALRLSVKLSMKVGVRPPSALLMVLSALLMVLICPERQTPGTARMSPK